MYLFNFKKQCQDLRNSGHTLGEITKITNRPKTTVYFHIKDITPTEECLEKIRLMRIKKIIGHGPKKGRSILGHSYRKFENWTPSTVNLVAHMIFDGAIRREGVLYYNRSGFLIDNFRKKMATVYNGKPRVYSSNNGVVRLAYHNVELLGFFKKRSKELLYNVEKLSLECQHQFLKAFFDDEGSVDFRLNGMKRRIKGYQKNTKILVLVNKLLKNFGIISSVDNRFHEILVTKQINIARFAKKINFSKGVRVNGKRSNSVWKKSFEKRIILANLLASYRH